MDDSKRVVKKRPRQSSQLRSEPDAIKAQKQLKKRIQNRNSQKCYREKQLSYVRTLEDIVNGVGGTTGGAVGPVGEGELKLIRKNKELQDALLRLRKKFLSLSTAAMVGADDAIFQDIFKGESPQEQIANSPAESGIFGGEKGEPENNTTPTTLMPTAGTMNAREYSTPDPDLLQYSYLDDTTRETDHLFSNIDAFQNIEVPSMFPLRADPNLLVTQNQALRPTRLKDLYVSFDVLGIEKTMKEILNQTSSVSELENSISLAVRVMLKQSPLLEDYFNLMGGVHAIERIILWRINPTASNRDKIPPPFKPTTLQQHFPQHHYGIDFLLWGELRDQLLLYMGEVNVEQLNLDCILMLVQDVPHLNIALPGLETCYVLVQFLKSNCNEPGIKSLESVLGLPESFPKEENPVAARKGHKSVYETLKKYRLDNLVERKLSPSFAEKYPFLDLTNITTTYPVASFCGDARGLEDDQAGFGSWPIPAV